MSEQVYEITSRTATRKEIGQMDPWFNGRIRTESL